eukprot:TRINITY_DN32651_c0_g1_i1.p1 TRINITY_DN32651_c0_g1~~TRINITY_DN32651_c0_g1_i1.p1  ORF type:complete len:785 (-),score=202.02 TRINITY_DN32651_c0_g1_i1:391-2745(-)
MQRTHSSNPPPQDGCFAKLLPWVIGLPLTCFLSFGSYFCLDYPGSIGASAPEEVCCLYDVVSLDGTHCNSIDSSLSPNNGTGLRTPRVWCKGLFTPDSKVKDICVSDSGSSQVTTTKCVETYTECVVTHNGTVEEEDNTIMKRFNERRVPLPTTTDLAGTAVSLADAASGHGLSLKPHHPVSWLMKAAAFDASNEAADEDSSFAEADPAQATVLPHLISPVITTLGLERPMRAATRMVVGAIATLHAHASDETPLETMDDVAHEEALMAALAPTPTPWANTTQNTTTKWVQRYTAVKNSLLYSVYNFENVLLASLGGLIIDLIGLRAASVIFLSLITCGQALFAIGVTARLYPIVVLGRIFFGFGGESLAVCQPTYCARFFTRNGFFATAFSITMTFARIGSAFIFFIMPLLVSHSVTLAVWIGVVPCGISLLSGFILAAVDRYAEANNLIEPIGASAKERKKAAEREERTRAKRSSRALLSGRVGPASGVGAALATPDEAQQSVFEQVADVAKALFGGPCFPLVALICVSAYCCVFPFNGVAKLTFQNKFRVAQGKALFWVMLYVLASGISAPFCGLLVEGIGFPLVWLFVACGMLGSTHFLLWLQCVPPPLLMSMFGVAVSMLAASLWPCVPKIVPQHRVGTAYGVMTGIQNLGLGTTFIVSGSFNGDVRLTCLVFGCLGFGGAVLTLLLMIADLSTGRRINRLGKWLSKGSDGGGGDSPIHSRSRQSVGSLHRSTTHIVPTSPGTRAAAGVQAALGQPAVARYPGDGLDDEADERAPLLNA